MKKYLIGIASAAALLLAFGGVANAQDYWGWRHHHHHHWHDDGWRPWYGGGGVRIIERAPPRYVRDCWYERRAFRDYYGYRHVRTVRVCS